jgi:hypothetical protein
MFISEMMLNENKMGTVILMKSSALLAKTSLAVGNFEFVDDVRARLEIDRI